MYRERKMLFFYVFMSLIFICQAFPNVGASSQSNRIKLKICKGTVYKMRTRGIMGNHTLKCTGAKCTAACQGKDCVAQCTGIGCKDLQEIAPQKVAVQSNNLREGKDPFQETNFMERNVSALRNGMRNQDDNDDIVTFEYTVAVALNKKIQDFIKKHAAVYKNLKGWLSLLSQE